MPDEQNPAPLVGDVLGIAKATAETLDTFKEPIRSLFGEAWSEVAGMFGDSVKHWRDMRRLDRAVKAVQMIRAKGLSPKAVDPSILFPILDAASLVEDENLKPRWEALLANAATPGGAEVLPSFSALLSQISPMEAQILHSCSPHRLRMPS